MEGGIGVFVRLGLRRAFHQVLVAGADEVPAPADRPLLLCANHSNWWDGFVAYQVTRRCLPGRRMALLQEERHLAEYPWFRRCGVVGVDLRSPGATVGGIRAALRILRSDPAVALWIFPQGELVHADAPVVLRPGAAFLAGKAGAHLVPVAIRYEWFVHSRPSVLVRLGAPVVGGALEDALRGLVGRVREEARLGRLGEYRAAVAPGRSLNDWWLAAKRSLGWPQK